MINRVSSIPEYQFLLFLISVYCLHGIMMDLSVFKFGNTGLYCSWQVVQVPT